MMVTTVRSFKSKKISFVNKPDFDFNNFTLKKISEDSLA